MGRKYRISGAYLGVLSVACALMHPALVSRGAPAGNADAPRTSLPDLKWADDLSGKLGSRVPYDTAVWLAAYFRPVLVVDGEAGPRNLPVSGRDFLALCLAAKGGGHLTLPTLLSSDSCTSPDDDAKNPSETENAAYKKYFLPVRDDWEAFIRDQKAELPDQGSPVMYAWVTKMGDAEYSIQYAALRPFNFGATDFPLPSWAFDHQGDWLLCDFLVVWDGSAAKPELRGVVTYTHGRQMFTTAGKLVENGVGRFLPHAIPNDQVAKLGAGLHLPIYQEAGRGEFWPYPGGPGPDRVERGISGTNLLINEPQVFGLFHMTDCDQVAKHDGSTVITPIIRLITPMHKIARIRQGKSWPAITLDCALIRNFTGRWGHHNKSPQGPRFQADMWLRIYQKPEKHQEALPVFRYPDEATCESTQERITTAIAALLGSSIVGYGLGILGAVVAITAGASVNVLAVAVIGAIVGAGLLLVAVIVILILIQFFDLFDMFDGDDTDDGPPETGDQGKDNSVEASSAGDLPNGGDVGPGGDAPPPSPPAGTDTDGQLQDDYEEALTRATAGAQGVAKDSRHQLDKLLEPARKSGGTEANVAILHKLVLPRLRSSRSLTEVEGALAAPDGIDNTLWKQLLPWISSRPDLADSKQFRVILTKHAKDPQFPTRIKLAMRRVQLTQEKRLEDIIDEIDQVLLGLN